MADHYDTLIGAHAADIRCPHVHGYTEAETTCPVVLDLVKMQRDARKPQPSPFRFASELPGPATEACGLDDGSTVCVRPKGHPIPHESADGRRFLYPED